MDWDFYIHHHPWLPAYLEPVMCLAFFVLIVGGAYLWLKYMQWSLDLGKKDDPEE